MAAQLSIPGILPFNPHGEPSQVGQKWSKWKTSFSYFLTACGVRDDLRKKALLLHLIGPQTQEIFETLGVEEDATYDQSIQVLDNHFVVQRNVSFERTVFHAARQNNGESIEQYVTRLRTLAQYCDYGNRTDENIRDQVVSTFRSSNLRKILLSTPDLTLVRLRELGRTQENSAMLASKLEKFDIKEESGVNMMRKGFGGNKFRKNDNLICNRCGMKGHEGNKCVRAIGKQCHKCGNMNHFSVVCKSQKGNVMQSQKGNLVQNQKGSVVQKSRNNDRVQKSKYRNYKKGQINQVAQEGCMHIASMTEKDEKFKSIRGTDSLCTKVEDNYRESLDKNFTRDRDSLQTFRIQDRDFLGPIGNSRWNELQNLNENYNENPSRMLGTLGKEKVHGYNRKDEENENNFVSEFEDVFMFYVGMLDKLGQVEVLINETINPVLIDSGSTLNLVDMKTYSNLKYAEQINRNDKIKIFAYQSKMPLEIAGGFTAKVCHDDNMIV